MIIAGNLTAELPMLFCILGRRIDTDGKNLRAGIWLGEGPHDRKATIALGQWLKAHFPFDPDIINFGETTYIDHVFIDTQKKSIGRQ